MKEYTKRYIWNDITVMLGRSLRHITRSMDTIFSVTFTPIIIMVLFVYVFGGSFGSTSDNYVNYLLPGIMLMAVASGIAYTAIRLFADVKSGIFERFHSMPMTTSAVLWGHVLTSLVSNFISLLVIIVVALLMGFRSSAGILEWLAVIGILAIFTLALTWIAVIAGLKAKTAEGASAFAYPLIYLPFVSSAFVPTETMPDMLRVFAQHQPVTAIVDSIRGLLFAQPIGNEIWIALLWCLGIFMFAYVMAMRTYHQKARH